MFKSVFFGMWFGLTMMGAILIDQDGREPWGAAWFVLFSTLMLM